MDLPDDALCPLTLDVLVDPVMTSDGSRYEREAIEAWFGRGNRTSPLTNERVESTALLPNVALRRLIASLNLEEEES